MWSVYRSDEPLKPVGVGSSKAGSAPSLTSVDDDTVSLEGYGDVDVGKYNEDGSFVGAYTMEQPERQRGRMTSQSNAFV